ncbi:bifunctional riboflavin kinase/FAD synthetase [Chloroflexota bacterium]
MEIKELAKIKPQQETVLTIGVFDGVHLGHQRLLTHLKDKAIRHGWSSGVITFTSHPETVLNANKQLPWIDSIEDRVSQIKNLGIDIVVALSFTPKLGQLGATEFIQSLKKHLKLRELIIGPDFALGKNRLGNAEQLSLLGQQMGFSIEIMPPLIIDGEVVSSSLIRHVLSQGNINKTSKLLGRFFRINGLVIPGDGRGRTLGFPTANLELRPDQASPGDGVYVTLAYTDTKPLPSVTNIGFRPTFGGDKRLIETYIIDHDTPLSGKNLSIEFIDKLRDERRFESADKLKAQISKDVEQAKPILVKLIP